MILAVPVPAKRELVICAANSLREQKIFLSKIEDELPQLIQDTDFTRFLVDDDLAKFKFTPTILEFPTETELDAFVDEHGIELTNFSNAHGRQRRMLDLEDFNSDTGGQTLAELHGLVEDDPWDRRTPEEKAEAEEQRKKMQDKKKSGDLTGDSWGAGAGRSMTSKKNNPKLVEQEGTYWRVVTHGTMGNDVDAVTKMLPEPFVPIYQKDVADDVVMHWFETETMAESVAAHLRDLFVHVATVTVTAVDEKGNDVSDTEIVVNDDGSIAVKDATKGKDDPTGVTGGDNPTENAEGGLQIRDIQITVNDDGTIDIGQVLADKDLFSPDVYHLTIMDATGAPSKTIGDYEPILKRAGLAANTRFMGADYEEHEDGGILIQLGGAATLRMNDALAECGREFTLRKTITEREGHGDDNEYKIADDQLVSTYFRADAAAVTVAQVSAFIEADNSGGAPVKLPYRARDLANGGSWHAYIRRADAEATVNMLVKQGIFATLAEVDHLGERIVEEGADATVIDQGARFVEPPAPWNEARDEFYALDEKEQKKAMRKLTPFLLYSVRDHGHPHRIIVHITPRTYFQKHDALWQGELPLDDILPDNFEKFGDKVGVYQVKSLDLNTTDFLLGNKGKMRESLMLRAHLNSLGDDAT